jgi:preprotein translocase subunit SecF
VARRGGYRRPMVARNIVAAVALVALIGVAIYLLAQIPWEFAVGGILALAGIFFAVAHDAPDAL